jgi:hypothetical protein
MNKRQTIVEPLLFRIICFFQMKTTKWYDMDSPISIQCYVPSPDFKRWRFRLYKVISYMERNSKMSFISNEVSLMININEFNEIFYKNTSRNRLNLFELM